VLAPILIVWHGRARGTTTRTHKVTQLDFDGVAKQLLSTLRWHVLCAFTRGGKLNLFQLRQQPMVHLHKHV
jgi:hypothetical protein